jgi:hypothetical protein
MTSRTIAFTALAVLAGACASPQPVTWSQINAPVAYVETLPPEALVAVNGVEVGKGAVAFAVADESRSYAIRVTAPGFEPLESTVPGSKLAGTRLELVLRPEGFGSQRHLAAGEPVGLLQAAAALLRADRPADAIAFARASLDLGDSPQGHKVCGQAYRRMGKRDLAIKEFSLYLSLAPDAPDRKAVEDAISAASRDIDMAAPKARLE